MRICVLAVAAAVWLSACGAPPPLPPKPATVPVGIDLSGRWELRSDSAGTAQQIDAASRRAAGGNEELIPPRTRNSRPPRSPDYLVHVFIESGTALRITQTGHGLFISFDRSVVEEYRFGEQRMVSVGPVEAERVSGWESNAYVIETRDAEKAMLIESWHLDGPNTLVRSIRIVHRNEEELNVTQVFDRT